MDNGQQDENLGRLNEFVDSIKSIRTNLFGIVIAILLQVGGFLWLWGGLTTTVKADNKYLWEQISPRTIQNTRDIDKILTRLEYIVQRGVQ
jgi:hypothetical protein